MKTLTGSHVLAMILGFFAIVIAANATFITLAVSTFPGEDVARSYVQGLDYNATLRDRAAARTLGWVIQAHAMETQSGPALDVTLTTKEGHPLETITLTGMLRRPATTSQDRVLQFNEVAPGRYQALTPDLPPGAWDLRANANNGDDEIAFEARLIWPPQP